MGGLSPSHETLTPGAHVPIYGPTCALPYGAYLILYRIVDDGVEIVRVVHAARNLDDLI